MVVSGCGFTVLLFPKCRIANTDTNQEPRMFTEVGTEFDLNEGDRLDPMTLYSVTVRAMNMIGPGPESRILQYIRPPVTTDPTSTTQCKLESYTSNSTYHIQHTCACTHVVGLPPVTDPSSTTPCKFLTQATPLTTYNIHVHAHM